MKILKTRTNAIGLTFELIDYIKEEDIQLSGPCRKSRAIVIKLHLIYISLMQWVYLGKCKQKY